MLWNKKRIRFIFAATFLFGVLAAFYDFPWAVNNALKNIGLPAFGFQKDFSLGLDLLGGTHLIYEADKKIYELPSSERPSALEGVRDVIERRVNAFGVSEPVIQTSVSNGHFRLVVELAGVHDINSAIKMIGETPILEFKESTSSPPVLNAEEQNELDTYNQEAKTRANQVLEKAFKEGADFTALAKEFSEEPNARETGGDLGWVKKGVFIKEFEEVCFDKLQEGEISPELTQTRFGYHIIKKLGKRVGDSSDASLQEQQTITEEEYHCQHILIRTRGAEDIRPELVFGNWVPTPLSGQQLKKASVSFSSQASLPEVTLEFNDKGSQLFEAITKKNIGRPVAIFLDGQPISTPVVRSIITGGSAVISGNFTLEEAKLLAQRLNAGALRVPINLVSQQTVGPLLGKISIEESLRAAYIGLALVSLFIILYYRLPGVIGVIALLWYGLTVLALLKLIPVTLTLSGIAGFILSLGMAVDGNVLIFERLKEELSRHNPFDMALETAFQRAWSSIRDGNLSTLITCIILIWFSSSFVKGFALTLSIGILVSMLSAMFVSRALLYVMRRKHGPKNLWWYGVK